MKGAKYLNFYVHLKILKQFECFYLLYILLISLQFGLGICFGWRERERAHGVSFFFLNSPTRSAKF